MKSYTRVLLLLQLLWAKDLVLTCAIIRGSNGCHFKTGFSIFLQHYLSFLSFPHWLTGFSGFKRELRPQNFIQVDGALNGAKISSLPSPLTQTTDDRLREEQKMIMKSVRLRNYQNNQSTLKEPTIHSNTSMSTHIFPSFPLYLRDVIFWCWTTSSHLARNLIFSSNPSIIHETHSNLHHFLKNETNKTRFCENFSLLLQLNNFLLFN